MKKIICLILCCAVLCSITGCEKNNTSSRIGSQTSAVGDVLEKGMTETKKTEEPKNDEITGTPNVSSEIQVSLEPEVTIEPGATSGPEVSVQPEVSFEPKDTMDVDLTVLSSTMVYSEVYNMVVYPEDYIGKTVKMKGQFAFYLDESTGKYYFACIIADATACCSQGIEFELKGDYVYPDDYPEPGTEICVVGVFDTYSEGDYLYCTLRNARFE